MLSWPVEGSRVVYEGVVSAIGRSPQHRTLVAASSAEEAVELVRRAVDREYVGFRAEVARNHRGEPHEAPIRRTWDDIDWSRVGASLTSLQRDLIGDLLDAGEPTWMLLEDSERDRAGVEAAMDDLERRGLVRGRVEASGAPGRAQEPDTWWDLTDEAWDMLGPIRSR